jgi:hypothetical protein
MSRVRWLPLVLLAVGCSQATAPTAAGVDLLPEHTVYAPGDTVQAQLLNRSSDPIGYGACSLSLEQQTASGWIRVSPHPGTCIGILYVLEPGGRRAQLQVLDAALPPGTYRLRQQVMPHTSLPERNVFSPVFTVRAPA